MFSPGLPKEMTPLCLAPLPLFKKWELKSVSSDFCKIITDMNVDAEIAAYIKSTKERFPMFILMQFKVRDFANIAFKDIKELGELSSWTELVLAGQLGEKENFFSLRVDEYIGDERVDKFRINFSSNTTHTAFWHYAFTKSNNSCSPLQFNIELFTESKRYTDYGTMLTTLFSGQIWCEFENATCNYSESFHLKLPAVNFS